MSALVGWGTFLTLMAVVTSGLVAGQMLAIGLANLADRGQPEAEWTRRFQFENTSGARALRCGDRDDVDGAGDNPDR
jgi:hypothetical protein